MPVYHELFQLANSGNYVERTNWNAIYSSAKPLANDVRLVIEVADTTPAYDREIKLPVYACAGVKELWVVNLNDAFVEVYHGPQSTGNHGKRTDFSRADSVPLLAFRDVVLMVGDLLG